MKLPPHQWPETDLGRGALFFFQLIREQIASDTFESFRAMTLDSIARLEEAITVVHKVQSKHIPAAALDPVYAELIWSLNKDPVVSQHFSPEVSTVTEILKDRKTSISDQHLCISHLLGRLRPHYKRTIERELIDLFPNPAMRLRVRQLGGFYCSHLINLGYSKAYIQRVLDSEILNEPVQRVRPQLLIRFFSLFDATKRRMKVITPVQENTADLLKRLGYMLASSPDALRHPSAIQHYKNSNCANFLITSVESLDEEGAVQKAESALASLRAIAAIGPKPATFSWSQERYVIRSKSGRGCLIRPLTLALGRLPIELRAGGSTSKAIKAFAKGMMSTFDSDSTERLISSINTCALARNSTDKEVQLISIWSAIEVLLSDPDPEEARIVHYVRHMTPCICAKYARRQLTATYEQLLLQYKRGLRRLILKEPDFRGEDDYLRFAAILTLGSNKGLQGELLELCANNPLALNRVSKLHRDFATPDNMMTSLRAHSDRVAWQLHRIYRARNDLVHGGRSPTFMDALILNALEYYTSALRSISSFGKKNSHAGSIDQAVVGVGIEHKIYLNYLASIRKDGKMKPIDVKKLFGA